MGRENSQTRKNASTKNTSSPPKTPGEYISNVYIYCKNYIQFTQTSIHSQKNLVKTFFPTTNICALNRKENTSEFLHLAPLTTSRYSAHRAPLAACWPQLLKKKIATNLSLKKRVSGWTVEVEAPHPEKRWSSNWIHLPQIGMKIKKNMWNHHLGFLYHHFVHGFMMELISTWW